MIRLRTFGSLDLKDSSGGDLRPVLAQPKRLALLVYLALARPGSALRRDELLALFWPDLDDARARDALNQALRFLRQALGPEVFLRRGAEDVGLDPARLWCDAAEFNSVVGSGRSAEALELYRGDFLRGFFVEDAGGFEEWVERERVGFQAAAAGEARRLADRLAEEGALTQAVLWGRRALELSPDDERALRRLLRLYDRAGDRVGGLKVYDAFARRMEAEFSCQPSPETAALASRLRSGTPLDPDSGGGRKEPAPAGQPRPPDRPAPAGDLSGRYRIERELGAGGMARVYLARDLKHDREVALKVLRPEIAEGLARERFVREIGIAGRLQHPNIVPLFDSGEADGKLFFVMPNVQGETLRERLKREGRLESGEAVHLLREIAGALAYAHAAGVIHRDLKPENVLLIDRRAVLSDFGIARAAHIARTPAGQAEFDPTLTQPGASLGTPAYMAPEQVAGSRDVDQRADLYSLGVVAYEMLAGRTPFTGGTAQELLAAQLTQQPAPLREVQPEVPAALADLVMQCLAKQPENRPATAGVILNRLDGERAPEPRAVRSRRRFSRRGAAIAGMVLAVGVGGAAAVRSLTRSGQQEQSRTPPDETGTKLPLDTSRYAILPFTRGPGVPADLPIEQLVQDGLARWSGISIADRFQVADAVARQGTTPLSSEDAERVASSIGAGRYIRGEVTLLGDSLRVHAGAYDLTRSDRLRTDATVRVAGSLRQADSGFASLADILLSIGSLPGPAAEVGNRTRSLPARQAYGRGQAAILEWELARADSEFVRASKLDPAYSVAFLWLAQVRNWRGLPALQWVSAAEQAALDRNRLTPRERVFADALLALSADEVPRACALMMKLTRTEPEDFAAWYGTGTCLSRDSVVVRDRRSSTGWAFRASHGAALGAYTQAFRLLPSIHRSLHDRGFEPVRSLFKTSQRYTRSGIAAGDPGRKFVAMPSWEGDSLAFVPRPVEEFRHTSDEAIPASVGIAVLKQRELFHRVAGAWASDNSESPQAMEALALSMELLADPGALDTLRRARRLSHNDADRLRLAAAEVWMALKLSVPSDQAGIRAARRLADSILATASANAAPAPALLVSLAVLTGRASLAENLARNAAPREFLGVPPQISKSAAPLLALAALGGPSERLRELTQEVDQGIRRQLPAPEREPASVQWLVRPATLAFSTPAPPWFSSIAPSGDYLLEAQQSYLRGDTAAVRGTLVTLRQARRFLAPEDLALDALYPESQLLALLGDLPAAVSWLDPTLTELSHAAPMISVDPAPFGALVRAVALRADLAARAGDPEAARRWAAVVTILWSDADRFLQPVVDRMRRLARP